MDKFRFVHTLGIALYMLPHVYSSSQKHNELKVYFHLSYVCVQEIYNCSKTKVLRFIYYTSKGLQLHGYTASKT